MFESTQNKGFAIEFENGWSISVQWGPSNYCHNRHMNGPSSVKSIYTSPDAEVLIRNPYGTGVEHPDWAGTYDVVRGWCKPDEIAKYIAWTAGQPA